MRPVGGGLLIPDGGRLEDPVGGGGEGFDDPVGGGGGGEDPVGGEGGFEAPEGGGSELWGGGQGGNVPSIGVTIVLELGISVLA